MSKQEIYSYLLESEELFQRRYQHEIERNRKDSFTLKIVNQKGEFLKDATLEMKLKQHDFHFGANLFMLEEYDSEEKNKQYEAQFCDLFNSAVIPLYWEGTEPEQGLLRYGKDSERNVYRRPPVEAGMDFCKRNGLKMKGHPLFWHEFIPSWLPEDYQELKPLLVKRFQEIAQWCGDQIECYDVVNEPSRIYDVMMRDKNTSRKYLVPEDDYCLWLFQLARQYFPASQLILNDTVGASFHEFRGKYSGFYLNIKDLLSRGAQIDEIGLQCHLGSSGGQNVYDSERLYAVLDTYASLDKPIHISEISIPSLFDGEPDEELQAMAAKRLYQVCFGHKAVTGITWWNLPDDGVLTTKRKAGDENSPSTGLIDLDGREKKAYQVLKQLIHDEWNTHETMVANEGVINFRGFYGTYEVTILWEGRKISKTISFSRRTPTIQTIQL